MGRKQKIDLKSFSMRTLREWVLAAADMLMVAAVFFATAILTQTYVIDAHGSEYVLSILVSTPIVVACFFVSFVLFKVSKVVWRFARVKEYIRIVGACLVGTLLFAGVDQLAHFVSSKDFVVGDAYRGYPVYIVMAFSTTMSVTLMHLIYEMLYSYWSPRIKMSERKRTMIVGAGSTGSTVVEELSRKNSIYIPVCLVDDDMEKQGRTIDNVPIVGSTQEIPRLVTKYSISTIIFAIPSISAQARKSMLATCMSTGCQVKVLPYISELVGTSDMVSQIRDINIADLLGRPQITFVDKGVSSYIENKVCMITGGGGSIGSELVRQIVKYHPEKVVIVDVYENSAYEIQQEILRTYGADYPIRVEIASITDRDKMDELFTEHMPKIVFHAAAHKHVPLMETNPEEACKNNIFGTLNVAQMADKHGVEKFVMISTDKAVNPTNVMGATKRCCEKFVMISTDKAVNPTNVMGATKRCCEEIVQMMAQSGSKTEFAAVRFGNVLGSNGSVIPLFKEQIKNGGPVTVTHPDIIRYFMTIPEAVSLVLQAGTFAKGGEIFVLNMGEPVKILTLAENLITMMGYTPYKDIEIKFTGLRPGEKLFEELLMKEEGLQKTPNEKIFIGKQVKIDRAWLLEQLEKMRAICATNDKEAVVEQLKVLVPTFNHDKSYLRAIGGSQKVVTSGESAGTGVIGSKPAPESESAEKIEVKKVDSGEKAKVKKSAGGEKAEAGAKKPAPEKKKAAKAGEKKASAKKAAKEEKK